ncbi:MAG: flagellin, partial [Alphaproteobacteria bacterium]
LTQVTDTMTQVRTTLTRLSDTLSTEQRTQYENQYNSLAKQIADFIADAKYNGITLLGGTSITSIRNEAGDAFTVTAETAASLSIQAAAPASATLATTSLTTTFQTVENAVASALNKFGTSMQYVENQITYNSKKNDALNDGLGALVDADLAKESANLQALQTRQQLGIQTLSLANQGPQVLLSLFR